MEREQESPDAFTSHASAPPSAEWVILVLLLALALFLRLYRLREVPPGIHNDEIINAEIVERLRSGAPISPLYDAGTGNRETLYYFLLIAGRALTSRVPYWFRLPAVACSLLTILLVYQWSRRRLGPWTALTAVGGLAVAFWPVYLGREVLRSALVPLLGMALALPLWRGLERLACDWRAVGWFALAGLLLGALQYTYPAARVVPLFVGLFIAYLALFHRARFRVHWRGFLLLLVIGALVAAPAAVYIGTRWGQQHRIMALKGPLEALLSGDPRPVLSSIGRTLGMFVWRGDPQPHYNLPGRPVFEPVGGLLFLGGVAVTLLNLRDPAHAYVLLWTVALLVPGMVTQPAPHFSRTAGALATTFIFPGLAVRWLANRVGDRARLGLAIGLVALLVLNLALTWRDYFRRWPQVSGVRDFHHAGLADAARHLDGTEDDAPVAVCTTFLNERHFFWRTGRQALPYLMNRRDLDVGWYDCKRSQLFPGGGRTSRYLFGDDLDFAPFVPPAWTERARAAATFRDSRIVRLEVEAQLDSWLAGLENPRASSSSFGDVMMLRGYQLTPGSPGPGEKLEALIAWEVLDAPPADLVAFLHLVDADGKLVGQDDTFTALTDTLRPGDVFVQRHAIDLPSDLPPGAYNLMVGLYVREGERLSLASDENGDDALSLGVVEVGDAGD